MTVALLVSGAGDALLWSAASALLWTSDGQPSVTAGGAFSRKKRFAVRVGDRIELFETAAQALRNARPGAEEESDATDVEPDAEPIIVPVKRAPREAVKVQTVDLSQALAQARQFGMERDFQIASRRNEIAALIRIAELAQDEADVELLLMHA